MGLMNPVALLIHNYFQTNCDMRRVCLGKVEMKRSPICHGTFCGGLRFHDNHLKCQNQWLGTKNSHMHMVKLVDFLDRNLIVSCSYI